ncbi:hypothetical protein EV715DRAFT_288891 [Schizophyllum commune]
MAIYSPNDIRRSSMIIGNLTYLQHTSDVLLSKASALREDHGLLGKQLSHGIHIVSIDGVERVVPDRLESRRLSLASSFLSSVEDSPALSCSEFSDISSPATTCSEFEAVSPKPTWTPSASQAVTRSGRKPRPTTICAPPSFRQQARRSIGYKNSQTLEFNRYSQPSSNDQYSRVLDLATKRPPIQRSVLDAASARPRFSGGLRPLSLVAKADVAPPNTAVSVASLRRQLVQRLKQRFNKSAARERLAWHLHSLRDTVVAKVNDFYPQRVIGDLEADLPGRNALDIVRAEITPRLRSLRLSGFTRTSAAVESVEESEPAPTGGFRQTMFRWMMEWLWDGEADSIVKTSADAAIYTAMAMVL